MKILFLLLFPLVLFNACKPEKKVKNELVSSKILPDAIVQKDPSVQTNLNNLIGVWSLRGQAFIPGDSLEISPDMAIVKLAIMLDSTWETSFDGQVVVSGTYMVTVDELTFFTLNSIQEDTYKQMHVKYQIRDKIMEMEGNMFYDKKEPEYLHAEFIKQ